MAQEHRLFIDLPSDAAPGKKVPLTSDQTHYLRDVLRLGAGDTVVAASRAGSKSFRATIAESGKTAALLLAEALPVRADDIRVSTLVFALGKGEKNDLVCEKACELGVHRIIFFQAKHSVARWEDPAPKLERLRRIAESAARQSKKDAIPEILFAGGIGELLEIVSRVKEPGELLLCCSLASGAKSLAKIGTVPLSVTIAIGPEGDFAGEEEHALLDHGFLPVSLGPYVLRTETAAISAVAMIYGLWGYRGDTL